MGSAAPEGTFVDEVFEYATGQTFREKVGAYGKAVQAEFDSKRPKPPQTREEIAKEAMGNQVKDIRRRSASRTLFTGGAGVLDQAPSASTLMGL